MKNRRRSTFENWVSGYGTLELANKLKVNRRTVYKWLTAEAFPTPEHSRALVWISRGRVDFRDLVDHYLSLKK